MNKADILRSSREREKKMKNTQRLSGVLVVFVLVGCFLMLLNLNFFRLTNLNLTGQTSLDLSLLKQTVQTSLAGSYFYIVPVNSVFFFSKTNLATKLKQRFPGLQTVEIDSPNLNTLNVKITDRESRVLWCSNLARGKLCFYLNDDGLVYQIAPNFSDSIIMEFDSNNLVQKTPSLVINPQDLDRAKLFLNFLKSALVDWPVPNSKYQLTYTNVLPFGDFEAVIALAGRQKDSWRLLFNTGTSADQLITNFHSLIKDPTLTKSLTQTDKILDYLDLRFANKAFYRFK